MLAGLDKMRNDYQVRRLTQTYLSSLNWRSFRRPPFLSSRSKRPTSQTLTPYYIGVANGGYDSTKGGSNGY